MLPVLKGLQYRLARTSSDRSTLASSSLDGTIRLWGVY